MDRLERHSDPLALVVVANDNLAKTSCVDRAAAWASAPTSGRNFSKCPHGSLRQPEKPNSDGDGSRLQQTQAVACRWGEQRLAASTEAISSIPAVNCGMPSPGNLPTNLLKCSSSVPSGPQTCLKKPSFNHPRRWKNFAVTANASSGKLEASPSHPCPPLQARCTDSLCVWAPLWSPGRWCACRWRNDFAPQDVQGSRGKSPKAINQPTQ